MGAHETISLGCPPDPDNQSHVGRRICPGESCTSRCHQSTSLVIYQLSLIIKVWKKGIDSDIFHPKFKNDKMRARLTNNNPQDPVIVYVGRLGAEKNLTFLKVITFIIVF